MFVFEFRNRISWYLGRMFHDEGRVLWKITVTGPFVTLYSTQDYGFGTLPDKYQGIMPYHLEHTLAHGENTIGAKYSSELRDWHSHVILPCETDIVVELEELLTDIAKNNRPGKRYIDSFWIDTCVKKYKHYLRTSPRDNQIEDANNLILMRITQDQDRQPLSFLYTPKQPKQNNKQTRTIPDKQIVLKTVEQYLQNPGRESYEVLRKEACNFFKILYECDIAVRKQIIHEICEKLPKSSTNLFNQFVRKHTHLVYGGLFAGGLTGFFLINALQHYVGVLYLLSSAIYAPVLAEKMYTHFSKWMPKEGATSPTAKNMSLS